MVGRRENSALVGSWWRSCWWATLPENNRDIDAFDKGRKEKISTCWWYQSKKFIIHL